MKEPLIILVERGNAALLTYQTSTTSLHKMFKTPISFSEPKIQFTLYSKDIPPMTVHSNGYMAQPFLLFSNVIAVGKNKNICKILSFYLKLCVLALPRIYTVLVIELYLSSIARQTIIKNTFMFGPALCNKLVYG